MIENRLNSICWVCFDEDRSHCKRMVAPVMAPLRDFPISLLRMAGAPKSCASSASNFDGTMSGCYAFLTKVLPSTQ